MKLLFDLFPVILFFATFKYSEKNPEAAAGWMNALLGGTVDLKQAPILLATVVVIATTGGAGITPPLKLVPVQLVLQLPGSRLSFCEAFG